MIEREAKTELLECAREYPVVTILGPRQSGKTTLAQMTFPSYQYFSLEDPDTRREATTDPRSFLDVGSDCVILDEVQRVPDLLSYIQGIVDKNQISGQFILTGSHQPQVHKVASQSLAGRTAIIELWPFTVNEASLFQDIPQSAFEWIHRGFYPRVYEKALRPMGFYRSYCSTYVERDLRALIQLKDLSRFHVFLRLLAGRIGQLINYSSIAADVGVSSTTIKDWISVLQASYIVFELNPWFANIRKRLVRSSKIFFVDVGFASWLLGLENAAQVERDPLRGALYENLLISNHRKQILNKGYRPTFHFFRDSNGNEVDLLISNGHNDFTAIEIKSAKTFHPEFLKGLRVFQKAVKPDVKVTTRVWYRGDRDFTFKGTAVMNPLKMK